MKKSLRVIYVVYLKFFSSVLFLLVNSIELLPRGRVVSTFFLEKIWDRTEKVDTTKGPISFAAPDWLSKYRANSLYEKSPETIAFLNTLTKESILWDIGANIGIYSIYAGKVTGARVYAFEPSMMNLELLFRNIQVNNLGDRITIIPLALSDKDSVLDLFMSRENLHWAGAHNSIGQNTSQDGKAMTEPKVSSQLSATGANLISQFNVPAPTHVKIDVDGLESLVIQGLQFYIEKIQYILVEVDANNKSEDSSISSLLKSKNFSKISDFAGNRYVGNQLWKNESNLG
jgi:FkbM family methyltransferase